MPRSKWKIAHVDPKLFSMVTYLHRATENIHRLDPNKLSPVPESSDEKKRLRPIRLVTSARCSSILDSFSGLSIQVHNGRKFQPLKLSSKLVSKKLGEFVHTRKIMKHKDLKKKGVTKKKK